MGHGIAQVAALAGHPTCLFDIDEAALEAALSRVAANLEKGVELGKVEARARDEALARLSTTLVLEEAVDGVGFVIEAAPERLELKRTLLAQASENAPADAVLATNTSSLSIDAIAEPLDDPSRPTGRGTASSDDTVAAALALAEGLGKTAIVVRDSPGFASSRLGVALGLEAIRMVEEGVASAEDIDTAMMLGYRHPMGPLRLTDLVGLDVRLDIARYLHRELGSERFASPLLLERMVDEGKLGKKTGEGFYRWE